MSKLKNKYLQMLEDGVDAKVVVLEMQKEIDNSKDELFDIYTCTAFDIKFHDVKSRIKMIKQPLNGDIFTIKVSKR